MKQWRNFGGGGGARGQIPLTIFFIPKNSFFGYLVGKEQIREIGDRVGARVVFTCVLRTGSNESSSSL
jgi:hypothetical protein